MSKEFDLGIFCGTFLSMKDHHVQFEKNIFMGISGTTIQYVGSDDKRAQCKKFIDASSKLVMPGLVNAHSHLPMHLFRGLADDESFDVWLWKNILPLEAKLLSPEFVRLGAQLAMLEAISFGITTIYDMYYFENDIGDVCDTAGISAIIGENFSSFVPPDDKAGKRNDLKIIDAMIERWGVKHPRIRPMIAPHAPYTCSDEKLKEARDLAIKKQLPIGIHVSETRGELENSIKEFGKSPVKRLYDLGLSEAPCIYAHCVHVNEEDIQLMASKKVHVAHNPEANMKLGAGAAPVPKLLKAGLKVGIGTDSVASNNDFNLWKEMDFTAKLAKLSNADNTCLTAKEVLKMGTSLGAEALFFEKKGQLRIGFDADFLVLETNNVQFTPLHDWASLLVYSTTGREVEQVYASARLLYDKGTFLSLDKDKILSEARNYSDKFSDILADLNSKP